MGRGLPRGAEKRSEILRSKLEQVHGEPFSSRICVDTAPLLERSYARRAGLGWIGRNTCLINQGGGSWFFLGELLTSLELTADSPPADRCGTCRRCIDACPTSAIVRGENGWQVDSRACISYLTIEKRGSIDSDMQEEMGDHLFGCDICQDVCPWNRRAPETAEAVSSPGNPSVSARAGSLFGRRFPSRVSAIAGMAHEVSRFPPKRCYCDG